MHFLINEVLSSYYKLHVLSQQKAQKKIAIDLHEFVLYTCSIFAFQFNCVYSVPLMRSFAAGDIDFHCCPSNLISPCVILCIMKSEDLKLRLL